MSRSVTELATDVLRYLNIIDAEEDPDATDTDFVSEAYTNKFAELSSEGRKYTYWKSTEIPEAVFLTVRDLVALEVMAAYGEPISPSDKAAQEEVILKKLRRHVKTPSSGLPNRAEYF
ncbi:MAG: hypothetical protein AB7O13_24730 [Alphaproteobacteria bacterium]